MFILKIALALVVTLLTLYHVVSWFYSFAQCFNIFRCIVKPSEQAVDFPVIKTILAIALILICVLTWKIMF